jgi:hypothetical protein
MRTDITEIGVYTTHTESPTVRQPTAFLFLAGHFNNHCFDSRLDLSKVLIDHAATGRTFGHFAPNRFAPLEGEGPKVHQISLNPARIKAIADNSSDELNDSAAADLGELCKTLVHELAHCFDYEYGKPGKAGYHSRSWGAVMKHAGLHPSATGKPGGDEVGHSMLEYVIPGGRFEQAFNRLLRERPVIWREVRRQVLAQVSELKPPKRLKFVCPSCGFNAYAAPSATAKLACIPCDNSVMVAT